MTFDDDSLFLETRAGRIVVPCAKLGLSWPPPEQVVVNEVPYRRVSLSAITDEQREGMTNVFRGALYEPALNA